MKAKKVSPLKQNPLHYAGQSINEKTNDLILDTIYWYLMVPMIFTYGAVIEWINYERQIIPKPGLMTIIAIIATLFSIYKIRKNLKKVKRMRLGQKGEMLVGECLNELIGKGYRVFHDLVNDKGNIDHLIVTTKGVFVVETKTISKTPKKDSKIIYDGNNLTIDGYNNSDHLNQVSCAAKWVSDTLEESTGKKFPIRSVILYPGWYVRMENKAMKSNTWALKPENLSEFINKLPDRISKNDMKLATFSLTRFIRNT